jgi:hypothetical protein
MSHCRGNAQVQEANVNYRTFDEAGELFRIRIGECPESRLPIARLTLKLVCRQPANCPAAKAAATRNVFKALAWAVIVLVAFVASSGVVVSMSYLSSQVIQKERAFHQSGCQDMSCSEDGGHLGNP